MYKKDGSLNKRYSSSRAAVAAGSGSGSRGNNTPASLSSNSSSNSHTGHSSGYSPSPSPSNVQSSSGGNKNSGGDLHYKKDGSLDKRYKSSQQQMASTSTSTSSGTQSSDYTTTPIRVLRRGAGSRMELRQSTVKKLFLSSSQLKRSEKKDFEREVCILARLGRHPNLNRI
ncbi:hypothetical protein BV898_17941 [Hypsibius exemplaris]|uniref:Protein kinase domain-containing protein n=1 Tax=Hypsibius exemplaris TaxID=2072580 RepID=A0A9X6NGK6_HYPEX|nr:hypothetical protein BV898_17941 [Hypsibius exemplaris]